MAGDDRKVMLLTGASRGIGHATVKRFAREGWRIITCSRQPFPSECPWGGGGDDHIVIDLADPKQTIQAALDCTSPHSEVWVSNGVYATGGRVVDGQMLTTIRQTISTG